MKELGAMLSKLSSTVIMERCSTEFLFSLGQRKQKFSGTPFHDNCAHSFLRCEGAEGLEQCISAFVLEIGRWRTLLSLRINVQTTFQHLS